MKLVVFDVDGTLVDSQALIVGAMQGAFEGCDLAPPGRAQILSIVGLSLDQAVAQLVPEADADLRALIVEGYRGAYLHGRLRDEAPLYPGARDCLEQLAQHEDLLLGVATGKSRRGLDGLLDQHDLRRFFVTLQCADHHPSKPHPAMLQCALEEAGVAPRDAVMIGDTSFDMEMADAAGTAAIAVSWGYHPAEALSAAGRKLAPDFAALTQMIKDWAA